ncbi:MAG: hypothetical protein BWK76_24060 [Desulfobulbaceae bacterium A2]|nr:MAG: hypothetical protein BWK76_24060 [Desulfobulbaceae bacterium A2]
MDKLGMEEDEPIEHTMITRAIENAQRKVEGHNFDIRKHLLEYDDVMNKQREVIYRQRREVLSGSLLRPIVEDMMADLIRGVAEGYADSKVESSEWNWQELADRYLELFNQNLEWPENERRELTVESLAEGLLTRLRAVYDQQEQLNGPEQMRQVERFVLLQVVDTLWKEHLLNMDHLKEGIGLRGYGQKNPLNEYKKEAFALFMAMIERVKEQTVTMLMRVRMLSDEEIARAEEERRRQEQEMRLNLAAAGEAREAAAAAARQQPQRHVDKISRNALCPCGSGKKYKRCCGQLDEAAH